MNLNTAIYNHILAPKYLKIYHLIESLGNTKIERFKQEYKKDIVKIISDIIVIKDKYKIPYSEDLTLIEKYKS